MPLRSSSLGAGAPTRVAGAADLNVIPVLNMFTILIPFLVSMASFSQLAVQRITPPGEAAPGRAAAPPLVLRLGAEELVLVDGERELLRLALTDGALDPAALAGALGAARGELPAAPRLLVAVADPVRCGDLVAALDGCRAAGFTDLGLAADQPLPAPTP